MKSIFTAITISLLFSGCSHKNAFTKFEMNKEQELAASSLQSAKIKKEDEVDGIFSAIYLNEVYPESFNQNEYFFIYVYLKDKKEIYNPNTLDDMELTVKLNSKLPLKIKQLPTKNRFSHLAFVQGKGNRYYLVVFEEQGNELSLVLESDQSSSAVLMYQKDEQ